MFQEVPNPKCIARSTDYARRHEPGCSVDVTIAAWTCLNWFDCFTPRRLPFATKRVTAGKRANRALLRTAMEASRRTALGEVAAL